MTPKQKAEEIYFKMMEHSFGGDSEQAKQCALIAVDYIWEELENAKLNEQYYYWEEVKAEIELL